MVVREPEGLWGFWQTEMAEPPFGGGRGARGTQGELWGMEKGAGRGEVRKEGTGCLREGDGKGAGEARQADGKPGGIGPWEV